MKTENIFYAISLIVCNFLYMKNFLSIQTKDFSLIKMLITAVLIFVLCGLYLKNNNYFFVIEIGILFLFGAIGQILAASYKYIEITIKEIYLTK